MIKYLGSKRRLVPVLGALVGASDARTGLDLFTGTTRVAQEMKRRGLHVTALDCTRYAEVFARCYVETCAEATDRSALRRAVAHLDALPGERGYVTETFCERSRFFRPANGARIDAIRSEIERTYRDSPLHPILLTSLIEAADRVDSTTGVQMAYVKRWAPRSELPLRLRVPELLAGRGRVVRGDAERLAGRLGTFDLAYLDPPYNQHRYDANYHIWETLVAWDAPHHYGVACKRADLRDPSSRSVFNSRRAGPGALARTLAAVDARVVVLSYSDDAWIELENLVEMCAVRGHVEVLEFDSRRYVGAQIGIHDPRGRRVGTVGRLHNVEYLVLAGDRETVARMAAVGRATAPVPA